MGDIGIKVSQKTKDVKTCFDKDLLFSSSFPTLNIIAEGDKTVSNAPFAPPEVIYEHGLGYIPAFAVYVVDANSRLSVSAVFDSLISCDDTNIYWEGGRISGSQTVHYIVFNWNLQTNYQSSIIGYSGDTSVVDNDFGIKISRSGNDINSCPTKDQVINSGGRTPIIHKSGYGRNGAFTNAEISHNLGYIPFFLSYTNQYIYGGGPYPPVSKYYFRAPYDIEVPTAGIAGQDSITHDTLTLHSPVSGLDYAYIIFKDPTE